MKAGFIAENLSLGAVIGQSQNIMPRSRGFNNQGIRGVFMWLFICKMQLATGAFAICSSGMDNARAGAMARAKPNGSGS